MIGFSWLARWWHEGNGTREHLHAAEAELRKAVDDHTEESKRARMIADIEAKRTKTLINIAEQVEQRNSALRAAHDALSRIRGG